MKNISNEPHAGVSVELYNLNKDYEKNRAIDTLNLKVHPGELMSLLGPSGCGKTTTLKMIAGLIRQDSGNIFIDGVDVKDTPVHKRGLGLVSQNYALFPHMTILENVSFGLKMRGLKVSIILQKSLDILKVVQLFELKDRYPSQLSGGQQQRVALARCFVLEPKVMLLDEPLGALDKKLRETMQIELKMFQRQFGITTILVTHDQEEALMMSDRIAVMNKGKFEQVGSPQEIYEHPINRFVAEFIGVSNFIVSKIVDIDDRYISVEIEENLRIKILNNYNLLTFTVGQSVTVSIRPEKIIIHQENSSAQITLEAILDEVMYVGSSIYYHFITAKGTKLIVYQQNTLAQTFMLNKGVHIGLSWEPDSLCLLVD